jgi:hypothetical protein
MRPEHLFEEHLREFSRHGVQCARSGYTLFAWRTRVDNDPDLLSLVNEHPAFWLSVLGALQAATFTALGRIYDDDRDTHSARLLLKRVEEHQGLFKRAQLHDRKVRAGMTPEAADTFVADAWELKRADVAALTDAFEHQRAVYVAKVKDIRDKVYAHAGRITRERRDELFEGLMLREWEHLIVFPLRLHAALFGLYDNGTQPTLYDVPTIIGQVLADPVPERTTTMEHRHAATDTTEFLHDLLKHAQAAREHAEHRPIPNEAEAREYVAQLVAKYPSIREVWLYGSRANGTERDDSDWDYLAFADARTLGELVLDRNFHRTGVDLMVVIDDGNCFFKPWIDPGGRQKHGTLLDGVEAGGLCWKPAEGDAAEATYTATKPRRDSTFDVDTLPDQTARRVYARRSGPR